MQLVNPDGSIPEPAPFEKSSKSRPNVEQGCPVFALVLSIDLGDFNSHKSLHDRKALVAQCVTDRWKCKGTDLGDRAGTKWNGQVHSDILVIDNFVHDVLDCHFVDDVTELRWKLHERASLLSALRARIVCGLSGHDARDIISNSSSTARFQSNETNLPMIHAAVNSEGAVKSCWR